MLQLPGTALAPHGVVPRPVLRRRAHEECHPSSSSPPSMRLWRCCRLVNGSVSVKSRPSWRPVSPAASYCTVAAVASQATLICLTAAVSPVVMECRNHFVVGPMMLWPFPCPCVKPRPCASSGAWTSVVPGLMQGCKDAATSSCTGRSGLASVVRPI